MRSPTRARRCLWFSRSVVPICALVIAVTAIGCENERLRYSEKLEGQLPDEVELASVDASVVVTCCEGEYSSEIAKIGTGQHAIEFAGQVYELDTGRPRIGEVQIVVYRYKSTDDAEANFERDSYRTYAAKQEFPIEETSDLTSNGIADCTARDGTSCVEYVSWSQHGRYLVEMVIDDAYSNQEVSQILDELFDAVAAGLGGSG
jgi:hypothetical protein